MRAKSKRERERETNLDPNGVRELVTAMVVVVVVVVVGNTYLELCLLGGLDGGVGKA